MNKFIWVIEIRTKDGELRDYECYLFRHTAEKRFGELVKEFPDLKISYGGQLLYLF